MDICKIVLSVYIPRACIPAKSRVLGEYVPYVPWGRYMERNDDQPRRNMRGNEENMQGGAACPPGGFHCHARRKRAAVCPHIFELCRAKRSSPRTGFVLRRKRGEKEKHLWKSLKKKKNNRKHQRECCRHSRKPSFADLDRVIKRGTAFACYFSNYSCLSDFLHIFFPFFFPFYIIELSVCLEFGARDQGPATTCNA